MECKEKKSRAEGAMPPSVRLLTVEDKRKTLMRRLDLLLQTGCLLMESGADTTRVLRNMRRVAVWLGLDENYLHTVINYEVIQVNYSDSTHSFTKFRSCVHHGIDLTAISLVSRLSWRAISQDYSLDQYERALAHIRNRSRNYTPWQVALGGGLACGGFCIQFGCDWMSFLLCSVAAILALRLRQVLVAGGVNACIAIGCAAFSGTLLAWLSIFMGLSSTPWHPLLACALFIVPGVPLINFVSDMLDGHIDTGVTRALHTLIMIMAMSFGIALAIRVCGIDNFVRNLSLTPHHEYWEYALAAAISAVGFSMIFNVQRRLLPVVAVGGMLAVCTRNFVNLGPSSGNVGLDMGLVMGSLAASTLVSVIAIQARHWFHTPHQCITIPSVIPMVPGVLMYRALFAFIDMHGVVGEVTVAMNNAIQASLVILCIALGVAIPNIFVRRLNETRRQRKMREALMERRRKSGGMADLSVLPSV